MIKKIITAILSVFAAFVAIEIESKLSIRLLEGEKHYAIEIALLVASIVHTITEFFIFEFPLRFFITRKLLRPESAIEGYWLQTIYSRNNNKSFIHYAYSCIEYDVDSNKFGYYGLSFEKIDDKNHSMELELRACFEATEVQVMKINSIIKLTDQFSAILYPQAHPSQSSPIKSNLATGFGTFSFYSDNCKNNFNRGNGRFIDNTGETIKGFEVTFTRISQHEFEKKYSKYKKIHDEFHRDLTQVIENIIEDDAPNLENFKSDKKV